MFTTKTVKIFDKNILTPKRKLHIWTRNYITKEIIDNDKWSFDYNAEVDSVREEEISLVNLDNHYYERIKIEEIDCGFIKIELL